jgi:hypothetical protein
MSGSLKDSDILSIVFLAFVAIIIASMAHNMTSGNSKMAMPTFALIAVCLWFAYDYMIQDRKYRKKACKKPQNHNVIQTPIILSDHEPPIPKEKPVPTELNKLKDDMRIPVLDKNLDPSFHLYSEYENDEGDHHMFRGDEWMKKHHAELGSLGDNMLVNRAKYMGMQPQMAKNIKAGFNKYSLQAFYEDELREHASREWWDSDHLDAYF